jgi:sugar (pentulose or hexulose) kinase
MMDNEPFGKSATDLSDASNLFTDPLTRVRDTDLLRRCGLEHRRGLLPPVSAELPAGEILGGAFRGVPLSAGPYDLPACAAAAVLTGPLADAAVTPGPVTPGSVTAVTPGSGTPGPGTSGPGTSGPGTSGPAPAVQSPEPAIGAPDAVRISALASNGANDYSRIIEIEAYS